MKRLLSGGLFMSEKLCSTLNTLVVVNADCGGILA
nr:MAG TPA: hypothetical protein [Phage sp. ctgku9]